VTYSPFEPKSMHAAFGIEWKSASDYMVSANGQNNIDFSSGIYCAGLGHDFLNHKLMDYLEEYPALTHSWQFPTEIRTKFLKKLVSFFPRYLNRVALFCEGSMANEKAIQLAEAFTARQFCLRNPASFHGNTHLLRNLPHEINGVPAAVILEPYIGFAAEFHEKDSFSNYVKGLQESGIVVIMDEIQAGFGRTGRMFGYMWYDVKPDLVSFGKGVANGMPLSGVIGRKDIMECLDGREYICNTHSGNPVCCAAGLATLEELQKLDLPVIRKSGRTISKRCNEITERYDCVSGSAGRGYVHAIHFTDEDSCKHVTRSCLKHGLMLVNNISRSTLKICPPLITPLNVVMDGLDIIEEVLKSENKRN